MFGIFQLSNDWERFEKLISSLREGGFEKEEDAKDLELDLKKLLIIKTGKMLWRKWCTKFLKWIKA